MLAAAPLDWRCYLAGFALFRVFDIWESQEAWEAFLNDRLMPIVQPMMEEGARAPETRVYQLHDFMS